MQETPQQYTQRILGHTQGKDPLRVQRGTPKKLAGLIRGLTRKQLARRPAPGKWSIAEILAHLADTEIVGSWRLRHIAGNSGAPIQAFDQNVWSEAFDYAHCDPKESLEVFRALRARNLAMLKALPKNLWENYGVHQERGKESVANIVRLYAGHDLNHLEQIERIVKALS
ncbi:MAG TPA: DinB family protein [Candidatus Angelobacter sp.]|nr:DinB family protein [Candidatus Angelobacter sp.]